MSTPNQTETISVLLKTETLEAAAALKEIAETTEDKETRKAAKRALYLLSQKGISPPSIARQTPTLAEPQYRLINTKATVIDGAGNQLLWFVFENPDGGNPTLFSVLVSDEEGVKDYLASRMTRKELEERTRTLPEPEAGSVSFAEVEPEYLRRQLAKAMAFNRTHFKTTPPGFLDWARRAGSPEHDPETTPAPIWGIYSSESIEADTEINHDPLAFFEQPFFETWFLDAEALSLAAYGWGMLQDDLVQPSDKPDRDHVLKVAFENALPPKKIRDYALRLEDTATILYANGQEDTAKMALAHALSLRALEGSESDPVQNPFLLTLMERSLSVATEMLLNKLRGEAG